MRRPVFPSWLLVFSLVVSGCSIEMGQTTGETPSPAPVYLSQPKWAALNLTGRLVYSIASRNGDSSAINMQTLDLATGRVTTIFTAPVDAWIYYASASPDGKQLIVSYVPPASPDSESNQALYIMPLDGSSSLKPLFTPPTGADQYIQVEWSPDGKYIYFVHNNYKDQPAEEILPHFEIFRMAYPDGQPVKIVDQAFWPRVSFDSSRLVYVTLDAVSGDSGLFTANADGSNARQVQLTGSVIPGITDAPIFSPDEQSILFSAPSPAQSYQPNWLDTLMGVEIVRAHNVPSDWWVVPIRGGEPTRLTRIQSLGLFGSISPDKKHLVSVSQDGLFVMGLDGSNLTLLIPDPGGSTVNWIP